MEKHLLQLLEQQEEVYRSHRPRTAEMDLRVARMVWQGRSTAWVAMEIPCSESTVYRALRRVKEFLLGKAAYGETLWAYIQKNPPDFGDGDAQSILEMLFCHYEEFNRFDTEEIREDFAALYQQLDEMSLEQLDQVIYTTCSLCRSHEMSGFTEGVKVGVRLGRELEE